MRRTVEAELRREGIPARVEGRLKRAYSIYQKMKRQKISIEQVYDLMAIRIISDSVKSCYAALGVIVVSVIYSVWLVRRDPGIGDRVGSIIADE